MIKQIKLHISDSLNPYENLAMEKYLLDTTPDDCCTLYLWQNENTVVIGKNQNPWTECKCSLLEQENGNLARRLSGGGAVFHDKGNLNFTFLCSTENYDLSKNIQVIKKACELSGIETEVSGRNDILAEGRKFSGNAFYNSKGKSYHHGTILINADTERMQRYLTPSKAKLETKGVKSVKSRVVNLSELNPKLNCDIMKENMIKAFEDVYSMKVGLFEEFDNTKFTELTDLFGSWEYIYGTKIPFTFSCEDRFEWGSVQLNLQVKDGIIENVKVYTDSMDWNLSDIIEKSLTNCRFEINEIKKALPAEFADDFTSMLKNQEI